MINTFEEQLQNEAQICILMHHVDMSFYSLLRSILYNELKSNSEFPLNNAIVLHEGLCRFILKDEFNIEVVANVYSELFKKVQRPTFLNNYEKEISYIGFYGKIISDYVAFYKERGITTNLNQPKLKDSEAVAKFVQRVMFTGYKTASSRILENKNSHHLIGVEQIHLDNRSVLKCFPTPYEMANRQKTIEFIKGKCFNQVIDENMSYLNFIRITDEETVTNFKTKFIFKNVLNGEVYYYKRRNADDPFYIIFGEQDRKDPIYSLVTQCQLNLEKII